jgi:hypothetical protein
MISIRNAKFAKQGLRDMLDYIGDVSTFTMVEIGSYVGDSTEIFAQRVNEIHCVDPWENGYDDNDSASGQHCMFVIEAQFDKLCKKYENINKLKMKSEQAIKYFQDKSLDLVYIDGLHTYEGVKQDIKLWLPKIIEGGWLTGHDYQRRFPGTIKAVEEFKKPDQIFRDTSWIVKV